MTRDTDDRSDEESVEGWVPIREVARLTGVNPVTLRAWERRYGLILPRRTPKGHRLYDSSHVQRILGIVSWLNRGVAVSQVRQLLDERQPIIPGEHNQWSGLLEEMLHAIGQLSAHRLDECFNRALKLYPPRTLCEQLLQPLMLRLEQRWQDRFGAELERCLFHSWLRTKIASRLYHSNHECNGAPLLLVSLCDQHFEPGLWLSAWLAACTGCPVEVFEWSVPPAELPLALEKLAPRALVLYASQSLDSGLLERNLPRLITSTAFPVLVAGPATSIHQAELQALPGLILADDPLAVLKVLQGSLLNDVWKDSPE